MSLVHKLTMTFGLLVTILTGGAVAATVLKPTPAQPPAAVQGASSATLLSSPASAAATLP